MSKQFLSKPLVQQLRFFVILIVAGLALAAPFIYYQLGWLSLVALLPLLFVLNTKEGQQHPVWTFWTAGFVMMASVVFWIIQTQPERWATLQGWWAIGGLVLSYLIFAGVLSLGFLLVGWLYYFLRLRLNQKRILLLLPAIWVLGEWVRSIGFSLIATGPNTTSGPHWNFGVVGFAGSVTPLAYVGRFVGLYGVGFAIVMINLAIWWLLQRRWKLPAVVLGGVIVAAFLGWLLYRQAIGPSVDVAALQLGNNEDLKIGSIDYHDQLNDLSPTKALNILVLPEYSGIFDDIHKEKDIAAVEHLVENNDTAVITSRQRQTENKTYNAVTVYRPDGSMSYEHDKQFLIPIGEAMPYAYIYLFRLLGQKQAVDTQEPGREISRGLEPAQAYQLDGIRIGSMACSGAISPELYRGLVTDGAQVLTNSASLSIFATAPTYHQQAQQMARFMAVANARPFVQATDGSFSFIIDSNGKWLAKSGQKNLQLLTANVATNQRKTLYSIIGEWTLLVSFGLVVGNLYWLYIHKAKSKNQQA